MTTSKSPPRKKGVIDTRLIPYFASGSALEEKLMLERIKRKILNQSIDASEHPNGIASLPNEILSEVYSYSDVESLKSLRLVARRYAEVLEPHLYKIYKTFVVWGTASNWNHLSNIFSSPHLAPLVELVRVAKVNQLPDLKEYKWKSRSFYTTDKDKRLTLAGRKRAFARYRKWLEDEKLLSTIDSELQYDYVRKDLVIETIDHRVLGEMNRSTLAHKRRVPYADYVEETPSGQLKSHHLPLSRREEATGILHSYNEPDSRLSRRSLGQLSLHGVSPGTLRLRDRAEWTRSPNLPTGGMGNLKRLELVDLNASARWIEHHTDMYAPWQRTLQNLEEFLLVQSIDTEYSHFDVTAILRLNELPKLRWIRLEHALFSPHSLWKLLYECRSSLSHLEVVAPMISHIVWEPLRADIEQKGVFEKLDDGGTLVLTDATLPPAGMAIEYDGSLVDFV